MKLKDTSAWLFGGMIALSLGAHAGNYILQIMGLIWMFLGVWEESRR